MPRIIECADGAIITGGSDDEIVANAEAHFRERHPDQAGRVARAEILAKAEHVDPDDPRLARALSS